MKEFIVNKVAKSPIVTIDLEDFKTEGIKTFVDIAQWLEEGLVLREKEFRNLLKNYDWLQYKNQYVALGCSSEIILPAWATLLVTSYLSQNAITVVLGSIKDLEKNLFFEKIKSLDLKPFENKPVIIKGCSDMTIPEDAYIQLLQRLQTVAKSLFYGEACSSVPLWKVKN